MNKQIKQQSLFPQSGVPAHPLPGKESQQLVELLAQLLLVVAVATNKNKSDEQGDSSNE